MRSAIAWLIVAACAATLCAEAPVFRSETDTLKDCTGHIIGWRDSTTFPSPLFCDWDNDGATDLLLGSWPAWSYGSSNFALDGQVLFYKNIGRTNVPAYEKQDYVRAGGTPITLEAA